MYFQVSQTNVLYKVCCVDVHGLARFAWFDGISLVGTRAIGVSRARTRAKSTFTYKRNSSSIIGKYDRAAFEHETNLQDGLTI